jgi:uncharacterized protein
MEPSDRRRVWGWRGLHAIAGAAAMILALLAPAQANSPRQGNSAYTRGDYVAAAAIFAALAERGDPNAQTRLGFMYATGRGVPQNMTAAAEWYRRGAEQGHAMAQYLLGLLYDKGQGVPRDVVEAHRWLNLSAARAGKADRDDRVRMRDAVATKMTRGEIARSRLLAVTWTPHRER